MEERSDKAHSTCFKRLNWRKAVERVAGKAVGKVVENAEKLRREAKRRRENE